MKITFAVPESGCAYWRAKQPCNMIKKQGLADVQIFNNQKTHEEMDELLQWGDVIVLQSSMGVDMVAMVARLKKEGKTVVGDYDDLSFSLSPFNPAYKTMGTKNVKVEHGEEEGYIWKDGVDGFSLNANLLRYRSLQDILKMFNMITTTGNYIKNVYGEYNPNISILPNSIDFNLFQPFPKKDNKQVRIGWTPSDSHYSEIWMVKRVMRRLFKKYGNKIKFVVLGSLFELDKEFNGDEMERSAFIGLDTYPLKLAALDLDIGICPLDDNEFNRAKSPLKWSEYSAMKIPSVVSRLEAYACVDDGVTGLVAGTEDEFYEKLCELVESKELRNKITQNAYDKNYQDYNLDKNAMLWVDAYEQAMENVDLPEMQEGDLLTQEVGV